MKVYTKTGDEGTTSLVGGTRVPKNHPRVVAYGDVDELISYLGLINCSVDEQIINERIRQIEIDLMLISAHFASDGSYKELKNVTEESIASLESEIDRLTALMPPLKAFVLPGKPRVSAECHIARTVCRRAERNAIAIGAGGEANTYYTENIKLGIKYLNRLSDYLFTLARYLCNFAKEKEEFWIP